MDSFDPIAWINTPRWQASRLGLDRMRVLMEHLGRPQDSLRFIHVAGTNGKGSTCTYLANMCQAAGLCTGLFTSPYIECFEERIRVNGANISRKDLLVDTLTVKAAAEAVEAQTGDHPTEFELMCAVALVYFARMSCDIVVLEVGLGGRLDATNVIESPEACVICRLGLDHTDLLGNTLAAVAGEKAGIMKPGVPVVSWPQEAEAMRVIEAAACENGCELVVPDFLLLESEPLTWDYARRVPVRHFCYKGERYTTQMLALYQPFNAALAIEVAGLLRQRGWAIGQNAIEEGITQAQWPGRFEVVAGKIGDDAAAAGKPLVIVDGGHNPQGADALAESLWEVLQARRAQQTGLPIGGLAFDAPNSGLAPTDEGVAGLAPTDEGGAGLAPISPNSGLAPTDEGVAGLAPANGSGNPRVIMVMGVLADKDYPAMIQAVAPLANAFITYTPPNPRALSAEDLAAAINQTLAGRSCCASFATPAASAADALRLAFDQASSSDIVVAFGTLYAIGEIKSALRKLE